MSEEDAFLDGIAADRADRTRLLVFADWLADRGDPREEFVRVHAKLLDMDGTEPDFAERNEVWSIWVREEYKVRANRPWLGDRWLDAICRVYTAAEVAMDAAHHPRSGHSAANVTEYRAPDHIDTDSEPSLVLCRGNARDYACPFDFIAETLLIARWDDPHLAKAVAGCSPATRGNFWNAWRFVTGNLREPPPLPELAAGSHFLGAQYIPSSWPDWGMVAAYSDDYFALLMSFTA